LPGEITAQGSAVARQPTNLYSKRFPEQAARTGILVRMRGQGSLTSGVTVSAAAGLSGSGTLTVGGVRAAVQELRDSSLDELRRLLDEHRQALDELRQARTADDTTGIDALATKVEARAKMPNVARLLRTAAKWGAVTIIAAVIGAGVDHEVSDRMGWTPPPITIVQQMSPAQMDELSHEIIQHLEQMRHQIESGQSSSKVKPKELPRVSVQFIKLKLARLRRCSHGG
jgi:ribosomal protein L29